jgi:hypothetical protein
MEIAKQTVRTSIDSADNECREIMVVLDPTNRKKRLLAAWESEMLQHQQLSEL